MNRSSPLTADQANVVGKLWAEADGVGRKALLPKFLRMPRTYVLITGMGTGQPIFGLCPFGATDYPTPLAVETLRQLGVRGEVPLLFRSHWYGNEAELPLEVRPA